MLVLFVVCMCELVLHRFILNVKLGLDLMSLFHFLTEYKTPKIGL